MKHLLVGTIPIIKHSHLDYLYEGFPVLYIDEWDEVTEEFLNQKYAEITSRKYDPTRLYMEYWIEYIREIRARFFPIPDRVQFSQDQRSSAS